MGDDGLKVSTKPMKPGDKPIQASKPLPIYASEGVKKLRKRNLLGLREPGGKR